MANKTFAILTDIHGNLPALKVALSQIEKHKDVDQIICLGDNFALGPAPKEVLHLLKGIDNCVFLKGNHDRYIIEKIWEHETPTIEGMSPDDPVNQGIVQHEQWIYDQLGEEGINFIRQMRISHRVKVDSTLVEFCHAWYERDDQPPSLEEAITWRNHVKVRYPDIKLFVFVHGHVHLYRKEGNGNLEILCQGSTGLPFDKNQNGAIGYLTVGSEYRWEVERFDYDSDATINLLEKLKPPFYRNLQNTLRYAEIRNEF